MPGPPTSSYARLPRRRPQSRCGKGVFTQGYVRGRSGSDWSICIASGGRSSTVMSVAGVPGRDAFRRQWSAGWSPKPCGDRSSFARAAAELWSCEPVPLDSIGDGLGCGVFPESTMIDQGVSSPSTCLCPVRLPCSSLTMT